MSSFTPLRLIAKDLEDIKVLSSCVQDAILPLKEMAFIPEEQQFALLIQRFCWEYTGTNTAEINQDHIKRIQSALIFSHISSYEALGIEENMDILELLAIQTHHKNSMTLDFAGGASINLKFTSIHVRLEDVGSPWTVSHIPKHKI